MQDEQLRNPPSVVAEPSIMPRRLSRGSDGTRRCMPIMTDTDRRACGVTACKLATRQVALNGVEPTNVEFLMACEIRERPRTPHPPPETRDSPPPPAPSPRRATPPGHPASWHESTGRKGALGETPPRATSGCPGPPQLDLPPRPPPARAEDVETIERMLEAKTDVRVEDERGEMALHKLARSQARSRVV